MILPPVVSSMDGRERSQEMPFVFTMATAAIPTSLELPRSLDLCFHPVEGFVRPRGAAVCGKSET
jgi:hypothetical protein